MPEFNRLTLVAAAEVVSDTHSHSEIDVIEVEWNLRSRGGGSKPDRIKNLSKAAIEETEEVYTKSGQVVIERALVERALAHWFEVRDKSSWRRLKAGLRFDGFEVVEPTEDGMFSRRLSREPATLIRMLPDTLPGLDMRQAQNEVDYLLSKHGLAIAAGHLSHAISAFQRGEWSGANGELRNFFENYLNEIAIKCGCDPSLDSKQKRDFLGKGVTPPFLLAEYNEWNENNGKPQYVQGLMSRMHPHGGHPGLSEEEDATFRLQISLVTARLFLRRLDRGIY
ncbi:hypothetical protein [Castellaniella sp.]|uniref:hypothetical protein n=1 Tax=Castellaniella sp. TaxID=1955812 RepID=UPI002AFEFEFA|nr:hypothetical protein [Castellaniella sp.]